MSAEPEPRVYLRHARAAAQPGAGVACAPGIRAWFRRYGLDYRAFLREGLPVSAALATGDAFAARAVAAALADVAAEEARRNG